MISARIFISYSHDSDEHKARVLQLAQQLRRDEFDTRLDRYVNGSPDEGWPRWMMDQVDEADFVLVISTRAYYHRFRGRQEVGRGRGSDWEGSMIIQHLYDSRSRSSKFIPVLFSPGDEEFIPDPLRSRNAYTLSGALPDDEGYRALTACLRGEAAVEPEPLPAEDDGAEPDERLPVLPPPRPDPPPPPVVPPPAPPPAPRRRLLVPLAVAGALAVGGAAYAILRPGPLEGSVAVLPLENGGGYTDNPTFPDALTEELITSLNQVEGLEAPSRRSVMRFRDSGERVPRIAQQLGVAHVLEGSVRRDGDTLRLALNLWDRRERQVWSNRYALPYARLLDVQRQVAEDVAAALRRKVSSESQARLSDRPTESVPAYALYLKGREHMYREQGRQVGTDSAVNLFRLALALDPGYGLAYAGLARAHEERSHRLGMEEWYDSAVAAGRQAVRLAPQEERAHASLGYVLRAGGRFREAREVLLHAATLTPSGKDASGLSNLGLVYVELGRPDSAVLWHRRATALEPTSWMARQRLGMAYEALGDAEGAEREYRAATEIDSTAAEPWFRLAELYRMRGRPAEGEPLVRGLDRGGRGWYLLFGWDAHNGRWTSALQAWRRWAESDGRGLREVPPLLGMVYLQTADTTRALSTLAGVESAQLGWIAKGHEGYGPRLLLAQVHALRGELPRAVARFREAEQAGYRNALEASALPALAPIRGTAEFRATLGRMQASAASLRAQVPPE